MRTDGLQITKIKLKEGAIGEISYLVESDTSTEVITHKGVEKVTQEFANAFTSTKETFVQYLTRLKNDTDRIVMQEITFDYKDKDIDSVIYLANYYPHSNLKTKVSIKTPKLPIFKESLKDTTFSVSGQDVLLLERLCAYAEAYINGDTRTKQM